MCQILGYHPSVDVNVGSEVYRLTTCLPDWAPDDQIVNDLKRKYNVISNPGLVRAAKLDPDVEVVKVGSLAIV